MINKSVIQGRFVRDPEMRHTQSGKSVCTFTIVWSTKSGDRETKLFMNCTAWNRTADNVCKWFKKGQEAVVIGQLETKTWQDKEGNNRHEIQMTAQEIHFCGPKMAASESDEYVRAGGDGDDFVEFDDNSELPF